MSDFIEQPELSFDLDSSEGLESPETPLGLNGNVIVELLRGSSGWDVPAEALTDGNVSWRPDLWASDEEDHRVLHVHLVDELRTYLRQRLAMASTAGLRVVVALTLEGLYQDDLVAFLGEIDAEVIVIGTDSSVTLSEATHLLTALSDHSVAVSHTTRTAIAKKAWERRTEGSSYRKGRRFEGLLAFLLHQVADFRVVEQNLKGASDEVDLVIQIDNWSTRCWHHSGVPFVLVEAKNWRDPVGQPEVTILNGKLRTKRQRARIGLLMALLSSVWANGCSLVG